MPLETLSRLRAAHDTAFARIEAATEAWLPGLAARLVFAAVLLSYFWNAALTKVGSGVAGFFTIAPGAYFQILPPVVEAYGFNPSAIPVLPWGLIVALGTYAEFVLPVLIVTGLATRIAALGMIVFVAVQSYVDIAFHGVDAATIGAPFDRDPGSAIADQRTLWVFLLGYLVLKGAGAVSVDAALARLTSRARAVPA